MRTPPTNGRAYDDRRGATERRILDSAALLIRGGVPWNQLGIRQIAERAEISRTAFYDFFGSKNELLEQLITGLHDELTAVVVQTTPPPPVAGTDPTGLRALLWSVATFNAEHGAVYRAFLDATGEDERLDGLWADLISVYVDVIGAGIDRARATHPRAPTEPGSEALARVLVVMTERTMLLLLRDGTDQARRDELIETLAQVWERSVYGAALSTCDQA